MAWSFTSGSKYPLLLGFNWKTKYHFTQYCTTCYPIWSWKPWDSAEHKELPYDTGFSQWCRWIYVGYWWHGCIHQRGSSITRRGVFGGNHTRYYQTLLKWTKLWIKKILKNVDTNDHFSEMRYVSLMNEAENLWPGSPSVWRATRGTLEWLNTPHYFQITHYMSFYFPMAKRKSWHWMWFLRTFYPRYIKRCIAINY